MLALYGLGRDDTLTTHEGAAGPIKRPPSYYGSGATQYASAGFTSLTTNPPGPRPQSGGLSPQQIPLPPMTPSAPGTGPVIINTTPIPGQPLDPPQQVPGAGPVLTTSPMPGAGNGAGPWYDLFDPSTFTWWKPVLLAGGIALFGGAILAFFKRSKKSGN